MIPTPPLPPRGSKYITRYNLLITIWKSHQGSGAAMASHVFEGYDTLEQCQDAGKEAKINHVSYQTSLEYTCIPTFKKAYI